ncbi:MAG: GNAT family N-acetyltransferase [Acidobacteriota bacterium]
MDFIYQEMERERTTPDEMDGLWAEGWRHFGTLFFRYSVAFHWGDVRFCTPLRVDLEKFHPSRSQKRILSKNRDLKIIIRDSVIDEVKEAMFYRHRMRFDDHIPDSIYDFFSAEPASVPCPNREICAYDGDRLIAASFLDVGVTSTSAVYAMFEPSEHKRSLGILTMLEAMRYSRQLGCRYYYPGYAYREPSRYDYKKNFAGLEYLDWDRGWMPYCRDGNG